MNRTFKIKIKGSSPLVMHSSAGANPLNPYTKAKKPITSKRINKTDADYERLSELDFLSSLYWSDEMGLYMPTENVFKMLLESARACDRMKAKKQIVGIGFEESVGWSLNVPNSKSLETLTADTENKLFSIVTVGKAKLPNTKAKFKEWSFECEFFIDTGIVDISTVKEWWKYAGERVGLGGRRPFGPTPGQYGRFGVESFEEVK